MNKLKIFIFTILGLVAFIFVLNFLSAKEPNYDIKETVFRNSIFSENDKGYCFGPDGGEELSYPCVFYWGGIKYFKNNDDKPCFQLQYLPEIVYGFDTSEIEISKRRLFFPSDDWVVDVCGKFISNTTWYNSGGKSENWTFIPDEYISDLIRKQLIDRGYKFLDLS